MGVEAGDIVRKVTLDSDGWLKFEYVPPNAKTGNTGNTVFTSVYATVFIQHSQIFCVVSGSTFHMWRTVWETRPEEFDKHDHLTWLYNKFQAMYMHAFENCRTAFRMPERMWDYLKHEESLMCYHRQPVETAFGFFYGATQTFNSFEYGKKGAAMPVIFPMA